jgi:hypothetical protein
VISFEICVLHREILEVQIKDVKMKGAKKFLNHFGAKINERVD